MDERIKELLDASFGMSREELVQKLHDIFGDRTSEIDRWYGIGEERQRTVICVFKCFL